jgi:membrane fusion protein, multidrug efflux system
MARRHFLVIPAVVVAFAGIGAWCELERAEQVVKAAAAPAPVITAIASRQDHPIHPSALGVIRASVTAGVRPRLIGKPDQVLFKGGEHVRRGDVLA